VAVGQVEEEAKLVNWKDGACIILRSRKAGENFACKIREEKMEMVAEVVKFEVGFEYL
jgi:hypothetical protein